MLHLKLFVPAIVHPDMFAWGVKCLSYAAGTTHPDVPVDSIDLRYNNEFVNFWAEMRDTLSADLLATMDKLYKKAGKKEPFYWQPNERMFHYMSAFLLVAQDADVHPPHSSPLAALVHKRRREADQMLARMDELLEPLLATSQPKLVLGVSIYQYLLLHGVLLGSRLRRLRPDAVILFGGDPFDITTSKTVMAANPWLDGCVVGPGEYAVNEILAAVKAGENVRKSRITRLVNDTFMADAKSCQDEWNKVLEHRSDYDAIKGYHGVEWNGATGAIHLLGRRGCAWAGCTFCQRMHVITKEFVFDPSLSLMQNEVKRLLTEHYAGRLNKADDSANPARQLYPRAGRLGVASEEKGYRLMVRDDADDADVPAVVNFLAWLNKQIPDGQQARFHSYAPARQMARTELHALGKAYDPEKILVSFGVPIETLNGKTTITMKKGGHPIGSIKAMKVGTDARAEIGGLYFSYYPMESLADVEEENYYLDRAVHLVTGRYLPNIYLGSSRDPIGQQPDEYGIKLEENLDPVMRLFGMAAGASHIQPYTIAGDSTEVRMQEAYLAVVNAVGEFIHGFYEPSAVLKFVTGLPVWVFHQLRLRNFVYFRRLIFIIMMMAPKLKAELYIKDRVLVRKRPRFLGPSYSRTLSPLEFDVLRFLYQQRKVSEVTARFAGRGDVGQLMDEFDKLGAIVRSGNLVMCVANDPEGLRLLAAEADLNKLAVKYESLDTGIGRVIEGNLFQKDRSLDAERRRVRLAMRN